MNKQLTPFGTFFRKIRKANKQTLLEASKLLEVSISYISAVEYGDRAIPLTWRDKIISIYNLDDIQIKELDVSIKQTPRDFKISFSDIERFMINFVINTTDEGEMRESALKRLNEFLFSIKNKEFDSSIMKEKKE